MLTHRTRVRTKRKASTVSRKGPQSLDKFETTRNATAGQGHLRRAPKPATICFYDVASTATLTVWLLLGVAVHLGWLS
jgi:hypothetical protein